MSKQVSSQMFVGDKGKELLAGQILQDLALDEEQEHHISELLAQMKACEGINKCLKMDLQTEKATNAKLSF